MPARTTKKESTFRAIVAALLVAAFAISGYHRRRAAQSNGTGSSPSEEGWPVFLALRGAGLVLYGSIFAYLINPTWMRWSRVSLPRWMRWFGVGLGVLTLPLFQWLFSSIGENITTTVATKTEHKLVTHGPYRWVRHPLYSVGTLFSIAVSLIAANWFIAVAAIGVLVMLLVRLPQEEARLIETFGDEYREYVQRTGALIPRFRTLRRAVAQQDQNGTQIDADNGTR